MSPNAVIQTERLLIRRATIEDAEFFFRFWTDPQVMKFVGFPYGLRTSLNEVREQIDRQGDSLLDSYLVVTLKVSGIPIGECKLGKPDEQGISDTDVKLLPEYWGHRYGVEIKRGLLTYLFENTNCRSVRATPNVENVASIKMQEAVGGFRTGETVFNFPESMQSYTQPVHCYIYLVTREGYKL